MVVAAIPDCLAAPSSILPNRQDAGQIVQGPIEPACFPGPLALQQGPPVGRYPAGLFRFSGLAQTSQRPLQESTQPADLFLAHWRLWIRTCQTSGPASRYSHP